MSREKYILFAFICNYSRIFPENWKYGGIREKTGQKLGGQALRAREARKFLLSLKVQKEIDQHEVEKAIKKIDGKISKPFWRK